MKRLIFISLFILLVWQGKAQISLHHPFPESLLPDTSGAMLQLSSLKGKVVLIDFWASWCLPCRFQNRKLRKLYASNKEKGFEIFGVSLDESEKEWKKAIKKDGYKWLHVMDKEEKVAKAWNIYAIPTTFLIDRNGTLLAVNPTRKELKKWLKEKLH